MNQHAKRWMSWMCVIALLALLAMIVLPGIRGGATPPRAQCASTLRMLNLALQTYHANHGSFPPAYIADELGRPMHSWRVLILPYLEMQGLYDRYRFDEPWNGPNNSKVGNFIPQIFTCPTDVEERDAGQFWTSYVAVVGPDTCWPEPGCTQLSRIRDNQAATLTIVEVRHSGIHWMEPRDLHIVQMAQSINATAGQGISSPHEGGANVAFADGSIQFLPDTLSAETLRQFIDIDDDGPAEAEIPE